jgi:hypothetical protein
MTDQPQDHPQQGPSNDPPFSGEETYQEGKRAGAHPFVVVIVVILGLWILLWLYVPGSNTQSPKLPPLQPSAAQHRMNDEPVMYHVKATIPVLNVITVVVPPQATDSQIVDLLYRFREARLSNTLSELLPPTTGTSHGRQRPRRDLRLLRACLRHR